MGGSGLTAVNGVDGSAGDEESLKVCHLVDPIKTEAHVIEDRKDVFPTID